MMGTRTWAFLLAAALTAVAPPSPAHGEQAGRGPARQIGQTSGNGDGRRITDREASPLVPRSVQRYREPAYAAGHEDGHARGLSDGGDGQRYDPVRHAEYRDAERGYRDGYGSRDAYRTNYRAGFRQGYEEGYRLGTRNRR